MTSPSCNTLLRTLVEALAYDSTPFDALTFDRTLRRAFLMTKKRFRLFEVEEEDSLLRLAGGVEGAGVRVPVGESVCAVASE